jgi:flavin reductase (DIM6/NTAB) family NADH-FMN oxidoreductase RutF
MVDPEQFRRTLGSLAAGVCVATTRTAEGQPVGVTVSSFTGVSLVPPLVLFCLDRGSLSHAAFTGAGHWAVNLLAAGQEDASHRFAFGPDPFACIGWTPGLHGVPLLHGTLAAVECEAHACHDGGDHSILVGTVRRARVQPGAPLLYWRGQYGAFSEATSA